MSKVSKSSVVLIGIVFAVTAAAYFVMSLQKMNFLGEEESSGAGLLGFLDRHGFTTMMIELGCLAVATVAAIALDEVRDRRQSEPLPSGQEDARHES